MYIYRKALLRVSGFIMIGTVWQLIGSINKSPALPPITDVLKTLFILISSGTYIKHITASLTIIFLGISIAIVIGFILGLLIFRYEIFKAAALPVIESIRGVAALTLFPLLIVLFGIGMFSRVFVIFWTAWPAVVLSTVNSLYIDQNIVDAARMAGANEWRIIFNIRIPVALQGIITGIRIGVGGGWIGLIAAEMLGATNGLGYYLLWSAQSFEFDKVYATIIVIAAIGGLFNLIILFIQKKLNQIIGGIQYND